MKEDLVRILESITPEDCGGDLEALRRACVAAVDDVTARMAELRAHNSGPALVHSVRAELVNARARYLNGAV